MNERDKQVDNQDSYETGSTKPPKSRGGLVAVLLVLVILLCGITSYLSVLNVRLVLQINQDEPDSQIQFLPATTAPTTVDDHSDDLLPGVEGRTVSAPEQAFYHWPAGVVVTKVSPDSPAAEAGLMLGDILTEIDGTAVTDVKSLQAAVAALQTGDAVSVTYCRDGESYHSFTCIWK
jgi:membrane-associated protease RseP (regulator of RpoE activity)